MIKSRRPFILHAGIEFIRGHCGKVATKAPPDRETGASAQAAIHPRHRVVVLTLPTFNAGQLQ
jgi:hypothetical protein